MLCSPNCERARAPASTPGRSARADCTATSAASSPRKSSAIGRRRFQEHRFPLLLARQRRQGSAVDPAHLVELASEEQLAPQRFAKQCKHFRAIALPVYHTAAVGGGDRDAVHLAQREPPGVLGRDVDLRTSMVL